MKKLKLLFPSLVASLWAGFSVGAILRILNLFPPFSPSIFYVVAFYAAMFFPFLFSLSLFVNLITGGEPVLLNSRYLVGQVFLMSSYLALAVYLNLKYMRNLLPSRAYYNFIGIGLALAMLSILSLSLIARKNRVLFVVFSLLAFASVGIFYTTRIKQGPEPVPSFPITSTLAEGRKAVVLYVEGLSAQDILKPQSAQNLANFNYLVGQGAWGKVNSPLPCISEVTFFSFLRGTKPSAHGYRSSRVYSFLGRGEYTLFPKWIFFQALKKVKVVRLERKVPRPNQGIVFLVRKFHGRAAVVEARDFPKREDTVKALFPEARPGTWQYDTLLEALSMDSYVSEKALKLMRKTDLLVIRLEGMKKVKLRFLKYTSEFFPFISPQELEKFMGVIDKYTLFYDHIVGRFLTQLPPEGMVIVVSPFSVEPIAPWRFYLEGLMGDKLTCGDFLDCPEGVYMAFSPWINRGNISLSLLDFAPTVAYYLGLPVEKESQGRVAAEIFKKGFFLENPILFIHSYRGFFKGGQ